MPTTTLPAPVSRAELELLLRAAVLEASPRQHGQERARRVTTRLAGRLAALAAAIAAFDVLLLVSAVA